MHSLIVEMIFWKNGELAVYLRSWPGPAGTSVTLPAYLSRLDSGLIIRVREVLDGPLIRNT